MYLNGYTLSISIQILKYTPTQSHDKGEMSEVTKTQVKIWDGCAVAITGALVA